jgi:hypothetical protein
MIKRFSNVLKRTPLKRKKALRNFILLLPKILS